MPRAIRTAATARRFSVRATSRALLATASLAALAACGRATALESGLNHDLALADQLQRRNAPSLVSTQELAPAAAAPTAAAVAVAPRTIVHTRTITRTIERTPDATPTTASAARRRGSPEVARAEPERDAATVADAGQTANGEVVAATSPTPGDRDGAWSNATTTAPVTRQPQAHTVRDGAFGSVAGAILGAAVSHGDRVRGGIIGAVAGGALGAIYGHSVDRTYAGTSTYAAARSYPTYRTSPGYRTGPRYRGTI